MKGVGGYDLSHRPGVSGGGLLPDGREWVVYREMFQARMLIGRPELGWGDDAYDFPTVAAAIAAGEAWDGTGDPSGWHRHPSTGRRRPGGDPELEFIRDDRTGVDTPSGANPAANPSSDSAGGGGSDG